MNSQEFSFPKAAWTPEGAALVMGHLEGRCVCVHVWSVCAYVVYEYGMCVCVECMCVYVVCECGIRVCDVCVYVMCVQMVHVYSVCGLSVVYVCPCEQCVSVV